MPDARSETGLKILYLCADLGVPALGQKGASVHVRAMIDAFSHAGHRVVLASPLLTRSFSEEPETCEAALRHFPPLADTTSAVSALKGFNETLGVTNSLPGDLRRILYNQGLVARLEHRFEENPPDIIYERASLYGTAGAVLARELDVPLLLELNAPLALEQSLYRTTALAELLSQAERWTLMSADAVLVVSAALRDYATSLGVGATRVHVLPNGVDGQRFHPGPRDPTYGSRWGLDGRSVLGYLGGLRPWHGVEILPPLLDRLVRRHPDLQLVIAGGGPLRGELERDLRERGLSSHVVFTGWVPHEEIPALVRQFDVALAPYPRLEHAFYFSPLKLFEYMACGVPVVAASLGQIQEVVRDGETGLLYPPGEFDSLAAACDLLLSDRSLRVRLGRAAARKIRDAYTWERNAARVAELARSVIATRRESPWSLSE